MLLASDDFEAFFRHLAPRPNRLGLGPDAVAAGSIQQDRHREWPRVSAGLERLHLVELQNSGPADSLALSTFVALCSGTMGKPIQPQMVVLGSMSLGGNIVPVINLAETLQVAFDTGAKRILLPMASVSDIPTVPGELFAKFQTSFYADPVDAAFKALGVE